MGAQPANTRGSANQQAESATRASPPTVEPPANGGDGGSSNLVRVTVNLTPKAYADLQRLNVSTGLSKTDVMNRALQVYALVEDLLDRGGGSIVVKPPDGETARIVIL